MPFNTSLNNFIKRYFLKEFFISSQIKGDKLFLEAYSIHPKFQLKYENKKISITLALLHLEKHFIYYFVPLIQKIHDDLEV